MIGLETPDHGHRRLGRLAAFVCLTLIAAMAVAAGGVAADDPTVTFDDPGEIDESGGADLIITDVPEDVGVGAYEIEIGYDSSEVDLEASATDRFEVESDDDGGTLTVVGYTGEDSETHGELTLAGLEVIATADGETSLEIEAVETLADVEGDDIPNQQADITFDIQAAAVDDDDDDDSGNGGNGGGGAGGGDAPADLQSTWQTEAGTTAAETGETVAFTVGLNNAGGAAAAETVTLMANSEPIAETDVRLVSGSDTLIQFEHVFTEPGEYEITVESETLGTVTVDTVTITGDPIEDDDPAVADDSETPVADEPADDEMDTVPGFGVIVAIVSLLAVGVLGAQRATDRSHQ